MKKTLQLIILLSPFWVVEGFAQSTTILPSRIDVPNVAVLPTCNASGKGQMVFNTGDNKMYFCNGSAWTDMTVGGFTLPYSGSGSVTAPNILFGVTNSANGRAISGQTSSSTYGIGVYGASTNTAPSSSSPSSIGVFGINNSQNGNGIGVYGQHDGSGEGIYGVVKNSGIGVSGIGLPVSSGGNGSGIGVKGESTNSYGVYGVSSNSSGVRGVSTTSSGIVGQSTSGSAGYFYNNGPSSTVYAENNGDFRAASLYNYSNTYKTIKVENFGSGGAAEFYGAVTMNNSLTVGSNLIVSNNLTANNNLTVNNNAAIDGTLSVNNGKGVAYNAASSTNLKIHRFTTLNILPILGPHQISGEFEIGFGGGFTSTPTVIVGDIDLIGGAPPEFYGPLYAVKLQVYGCDTNSCKARVVNLSDSNIKYNVTWNMVVIGF